MLTNTDMAVRCLTSSALLILLGNTCVFLFVVGMAVFGYAPNLGLIAFLAILSLSSIGPLLALLGVWRGWKSRGIIGLLLFGLLWIGYGFIVVRINAQSHNLIKVVLPLPPGNDLGLEDLEFEETVDLFGVTTSPVVTFHSTETPVDVIALYSKTVPARGGKLIQKSGDEMTLLEFSFNGPILSIRIQPSGSGSWIVIGPG